MSKVVSILSAVVALFAPAVTASAAEPPDEPSAEEGPPPWARHVRPRGSIDAYLGLDTPSGDGRRRTGALFNHARHGGVNINLARVGLDLDHDDVRGAVSLMGGTFAQDNQGFEEPGLRALYEARAGLRLAGSTWVDAGIFPSHLGAEGAISLDGLALTRSLTAESSPYYLAGVKLTSQLHDRVEGGLVLANGWQTIRQPPGTPGFGAGTWLTWQATEATSVNWSTWVGLEQPGGQVRLFNDVYAVVALERVDLIGWIDVGVLDGDSWGGGNLQLRWKLVDPLALSARVEHFADPRQAALAIDGGARLSGGSLGLDLRRDDLAGFPDARGAWRVEARALRADRPAFHGQDLVVMVTTGLGLAF